MGKNYLTSFLLILLFYSVSDSVNAQSSLYPYWGEYNKTPVSQIKVDEWFQKDTVITGWDWSLPDFVEPSPVSNLCIARNFNLGTNNISNLPKVNFPANPVISHWVRWSLLEPEEGKINFQPLIDNINLAHQKGFGSIVRLLSSATDFAPDWIKEYNIPIREEETENPKKTNYDVSHPEFHSRYIKFINALGESGIPEMGEVRGLFLGYASPSNGDEGIGDDSEQHVRERIDAWAAACAGVEHKVFMGGHSDYGFNKGFGIRRGFVEMYLYHIPDPGIGQELDGNNYLYVDETNHIIKNNLFQGEENEEYEESWSDGEGGNGRFGALESFPYRYFTANLRLLQMRCNYVLNNSFALLPEMLAWVSQGLGRTIEDAPDAWCALRESYIRSGPVKNFERWVYQRDAPGYETTPAIKINQTIEMWMVQPGKYYDYIARKGKKIGFDVDDRLFPAGQQKMAVKVSFYDGVNGTLKLVYENEQGVQTGSVTTNGEDKIRTATFFIEARMDKNSLNFDFELHSEEEVPIAFVRVVKTEEEYENTSQSPYGGTNRTIQGLIEAEHYDMGGEGFAYLDDTLRQGSNIFRSEDNVDVVAKDGASNGYVVSYTNEDEWLQYTVDVAPGYYDVTLYYYCGETPGDLIVKLDGQVLNTITGLLNQGWEIRDSITVHDIFLGTGGKNKILHLEFANGAGFDIDAIKFNKQFTPVNGVAITGCPSDTLIVGDNHLLMANISPYYADELNVTWNSSDESVATVDSSGMVTSISEGTATITVTTNEGGFTASCEINSAIEVISVYGLTIGNCPATILLTGDVHQLTANVAPFDATDKTVTWSSSNTHVATVDTYGAVTAKSQGSVTITATTNDGGYSKSCTMGIMSTGVSVTGVTLSGCPTSTLKVDSTHQLIAHVSPANAGNFRVNWSSSEQSVATVDENGWATALSAGETTITITTSDGGFTGECSITVDTNTNARKMNGAGQFVKVFPNPVSDVLHLRFSDSDSEKKISFYNTLGQLLFSKTTYNSNPKINIRDFSSEGILIVKINTDKNSSSFKVLVKTN